jgi:hypothetical protein
MPKRPFPLAALLADVPAAARAKRPAKSPAGRRPPPGRPTAPGPSEATGGPWTGWIWDEAAGWRAIVRAGSIGEAHRMLLAATAGTGLPSSHRALSLGRVPAPPAGG